MKTTQQQLTLQCTETDSILNNDSPSPCARCGGLLVRTFCISPDEGIADFQIPVWKCLQCGDLFDTTILKNRWHSQHHQFTNH